MDSINVSNVSFVSDRRKEDSKVKWEKCQIWEKFLTHCIILFGYFLASLGLKLQNKEFKIQRHIKAESKPNQNRIRFKSRLDFVCRCIAIGLPHPYRRWVTKRALTVTTTLPWLIGFGINLPIYFGFRPGCLRTRGISLVWRIPRCFGVWWAVHRS